MFFRTHPAIFVWFCLIVPSSLLGETNSSLKTEFREWSLNNGNHLELRLENAYGGTAYFKNKKEEVLNTQIIALIPEDQAEVVYWSRIRDRELSQWKSSNRKFVTQFQKDAFRLEEKSLVKSKWNEDQEPEFYAIYTSASWCQPCRGFTPSLVGFYNSTKNFYGDQYEMILCSWDESKSKMIDYMLEEKMPWYGNWSNRKSSSWRKYQGNGIPCLVVVDRNGNTLIHSYDNTGYVGPRSALKKFREILTHSYGQGDERLSVPTPAINLQKLQDAFQKSKAHAIKEKKSLLPTLVYSPDLLIRKLEDPEAEVTEVVTRLTVTHRGIVTDAELNNITHPKLEEKIEKAVMLWQFIPAMNEEGDAYTSHVNLPINIRLKEEFRLEELSGI